MGTSTSAKVGILAIIALTALSMLIIWKTEIFKMRQGYQLTGSFNSVEGLTIGSEVRFRGLQVGKITKIDPGPYDIKIYAIIEPNIKIPADSKLRVSYDGIVGLKFLEIQPGTAESIYDPSMVILGARTAAIVDFIDIGAQNLVETKQILMNVRKIIENPQLQAALENGVFTFEKVAEEAEKLVAELRSATKGIAKITTDPKFQENVKGTIQETEKTLSSANRFFESMSKLDLRASGGIDIGSRANAVIGNIDVMRSERNLFRLGIGEGQATRQLGVFDFLFMNKTNPDFGYRLGVINNQLGGGLIFNPSERAAIFTDIYDINNPRPNFPKIRVGYEFEMRDYMDMMLQADDLLNSGNSNYMFGVRVKPPREILF
jgi:phospholipid/cholesterol/gamma-HCH transport system substrate-binding protein